MPKLKESQPTKTLNADIIRNILEKQSLNFSEKAIHLIVKASKQCQLNLGKQNNLTISEIRQRLHDVKETATQLVSMLRKYYPYLVVEPEDKTLSTLDRLIQNIDVSLNYSKLKKSGGGRPLKSSSLKLFVQMIILTYEEQTVNKYITKESSPFGRERTCYNSRVNTLVRSIIKHVAPNANPEELMKMARRDPLPLDWARKMKGDLDEYFHNEHSRDQRRAVAVKKKLLNKGFRLS